MFGKWIYLVIHFVHFFFFILRQNVILLSRLA